MHALTVLLVLAAIAGLCTIVWKVSAWLLPVQCAVRDQYTALTAVLSSVEGNRVRSRTR